MRRFDLGVPTQTNTVIPSNGGGHHYVVPNTQPASQPSLHVSIDRIANEGGPELRIRSKEMAVDAPKTGQLIFYVCRKTRSLTSRLMDLWGKVVKFRGRKGGPTVAPVDIP
jgi:hypothetical protein